MASIKEPKSPEVKKELPKTTIKSTLAPQKKYLIPLIVNDIMKSDTLHDIKPTELAGSANIIIASGNGIAIIGESATGTGGGDGQQTSLPVVDVNQPIHNPEIEPSYPGGTSALRKFLGKNLKNPAEMEQGDMVAVNVKFVVGYDGNLQQFTVVKDGGEIFNNEVIRVLKKMPQWIPGKSNGQNVAVYFTIPIKFVPAD